MPVCRCCGRMAATVAMRRLPSIDPGSRNLVEPTLYQCKDRANCQARRKAGDPDHVAARKQ